LGRQKEGGVKRTRLMIDLVAMLAVWLCACTPDQSGTREQTTGGHAIPADIELVDGYLQKWDRFAQGENDLVSALRDGKAPFEAALTRLLKAKDERGPARMVFYAVVQVGGAIQAESELGKAAGEVLGPEFPVTTTKESDRVYFAADLYFWWEREQKRFDAWPLFAEWQTREFAQMVVIPMYDKVAKKHGAAQQ
jgi:hypothetical protein